MADNIEVLDGNSSPRTMKTTDDGTGIHTPAVNVDKLVPGTAATNLGKAEDAAHSTGDVGVMALGVRKDTPAATAGTDGDYQPMIFDATGRQYVIAPTADTLTGAVTETAPASDTASSGLNGRLQRIAQRLTSFIALFKAEDSGHSSGDAGMMALAVRNDASVALAGTDLDYIPLSTDNVGRLRVDASISGGGGTQYTEDAASAGAESLMLAGTVRRDTAASSAGTDGDYATLNTDATGRLHVNVGNTVTVDSELTTADLDTGGGTDTRAVVGLALAESGGALLVGSAHPLPASVADGSDVTQGAKADSAASSDTGTFTLIALLKRLLTKTGTGAVNVSSSQLATSTSPATLVAARATRRQVTIKNLDAAITVYVGPATVSAANGMPLLFGESITVNWTGLIQVIAASGTPTVAAWDEYD